MKLEKGNMLKQAQGIVLVTTNATLRKDGALVMGRGAARQARDMYPGIDVALGNRIHISGAEYGVLMPPSQAMSVGAFQVKYHWQEAASCDLIAKSVKLLQRMAETFWMVEWHINYPGIGNGRLTKEEVAPLLVCLPSNVHVWELA